MLDDIKAFLLVVLVVQLWRDCMNMTAEALDAYLDFLDSSTTTTDQETHPTPHIDNILHNYQQRNLKDEERNTPTVGTYEGRLFQLEKQLTDLLKKSKNGSPRKLTRRTSDSEENSESHENSPPPPPTSSSRPQGSASKRRRQLQTAGNRATQVRHAPLKHPSLGVRERGQRSVVAGDVGRRSMVSSPGEDHKTKRKLLMETHKQPKVSAEKDKSSLKVLSEDLDREKERRWKAEQAAGRLVEHVRKLQAQLSESQCQHEECVVREAQLDRKLREKVDSLEVLQKQLEDIQDIAEDRQTEIRDLKVVESKHLEMLGKLEESCRMLESERLRERAELCSRLHDSERTMAGHEREVETTRRSVKELKRQVHQLQELLANREKEHIKEIEKYKPLPGHEVSNLVRKEVERECSKMEVMLEQQKKLLLDKEKAYQNLEEEFRQALRIEASRYHELQLSHQEVVGEVQSSRETAVAAVKKEQRATSLVAELTAMIKEQKTRINELSRNKQEAAANLKERVDEIEESLRCRNKLEVKVQVLQEENSRLSAQATAQESVISGLREERQLWSKELAHQGAVLAQDRGRMEAELVSLAKECKSLRNELGRERDSVRIKEKQVEDQLQTIHQLKQEMSGKEHDLQSRRLAWEREQQNLQLLLEQEEASNQELQEQVTTLMERKGQLKEEVGGAQQEVELWKEKYRKLKDQWDDKMEVLNRLEQSMADVQGSFKEKEATLTKEKDKAMENARSCEQRLKSCDDAFRHQLETKQKAHDRHVTKVVAEKDQEIAQAHQRVTAVEEEMRELLKEVTSEKRTMEAKLQRLSQAFQELHVHDT